MAANVIAGPIGREQRDEVIVIVHQERKVLEAVAMIIYVVADEQKRAIFASPHEVVPDSSQAWVISANIQRHEKASTGKSRLLLLPVCCSPYPARARDIPPRHRA